MKLLVFAHTPPPHHGQSYMVELMLAAFGGDRRLRGRRGDGTASGTPYGIECYHVNARLSKTLEDIGAIQIIKLLRLFLFCVQAIWCQFRYRVENLYYVPAPGKRATLYRDWLVMFVCGPFFKHIILHWHAAGLAKWLETSVQIRTRAITYHAFRRPALSVVISQYNVADAEKLFSQRICRVNYGIPDPCRDFRETVLPRRKARFAARAKLLRNEAVAPAEIESAGGDPHLVKVLYLAHYMRDKGLFAAAHAVVLANQMLQTRKCPIQMRLRAAGTFVTDEEKEEFEELMRDPEFARGVECLGFVSGAAKERALREADLLCFPTRYGAENQPVTLIEAMAFGLPIVTTRWRSIPTMFPSGYSGLVADQSPGPIADALVALMTAESGEWLRDNFLRHFTLERYLSGLAEAFKQVERAAAAAVPAGAVGTLPG